MNSCDDDLEKFEVHGAAPLPCTDDQGYVNHDGARIWYANYGSGSPVILLHGGLVRADGTGSKIGNIGSIASKHRATELPAGTWILFPQHHTG